MASVVTKTAIAEYQILERLGQGASGVAYRALTPDGQEVAIKLLTDSCATEQEMQQRFVREVSVMQKLDHPGIVRHIDCGLHDDQIYLVMELIDGGSLDKILDEDGTLPWREACEVAQQVCLALAHAHQRGVIHRDLKPANLFLASDGQVKVGDFGLARDVQAHRLTMQGQTVGTCRYMAPEQVRGEDNLTGEVDVYAMGCLLYLIITGNCPFNGRTVMEVFEQHLFTPAPRLDKQCPQCPADLVELVDRMLAKEPGGRLDAAAAAAALGAVVDGREVQLPEADAGAPQQEPNLAQRIKQSVAAPAPRRSSYTRLVLAAVILAGLAVAVYLMR